MKAKRIIPLITSAMIALSGLSAMTANAEIIQFFRRSDYKYFIYKDGTVGLTECYLDDETVVIPERIDGRVVTTLGIYPKIDAEGSSDGYNEGALVEFFDRGMFKIKNLYIADTVTSMDESLVSYSSIETLELGDGLTAILPCQFERMHELNDVKLGNNIKEIGERAFLDCTSLKELHIPAGVKKIDEHAVGYYTNERYQEVVDKDFTIYGAEGSAAQAYAEENGIKFVVDIPTAVVRPLGDISGDGVLDTKDAMKSVQFALKNRKPKTDAEFTAADVNADGKLDSKDAMILINAVKNKETIN